MTTSQPAQDAQSVYDFWPRLIPDFFPPIGAGVGSPALGVGGDGTAFMNGLIFPADQFMKATKSASDAVLAPWNSVIAGLEGTAADVTAPFHAALPGLPPTMLPLQAFSQSWSDFASRLAAATTGQAASAFDRTYGALSDALGLGPARRLQAAWQETIAAGVRQQEARAKYAVLVQAAMALGAQRLMARLAEKADTGERIDSVLRLLRLWAVCAEEVVHETLQSEQGLAATAALTRSALAYRKRVQDVASIVADLLGVATRREVDEAYREIQTLKRELRIRRRSGDRDDDLSGPLPRTRSKARRVAKRPGKRGST